MAARRNHGHPRAAARRERAAERAAAHVCNAECKRFRLGRVAFKAPESVNAIFTPFGPFTQPGGADEEGSWEPAGADTVSNPTLTDAATAASAAATTSPTTSSARSRRSGRSRKRGGGGAEHSESR